ncbi:ABC transporter permease [Falsiroseomonas ponticola]|uniref:ABC transporter permease n=1 Tax=Falsiroseomonas ponticola TaxID=2786951 RepID=UPI0019328B89|nr:ABC transporter permease [Roseomonas ponticola]
MNAIQPGAATPPGDRAIDRTAAASQWRLMWWNFRRHKLAMAGGIIVLLLYVVALVPDFLATTDPGKQNARAVFHPPQMIRLLETTEDGWRIRPHVQAMRLTRDRVTLAPTFTPDPSRKIYLGFFVEGYEYEFLGLFTTSIHLFGPENPRDSVFLFGADRLGRDVYSRMMKAAQTSLFIGLIGVFLSLVIGLILGGISGYYGGRVDFVIQRVIEFVLSLPTIPIWLALGAALPQGWPPERIYLCITIILSLVGWAQLARVVRGRFLSLRTEDFVTAARLDGASEKRIIFRHMLPSFASHIIASITLAIPAMILAETALSFLGLGLQPPVISWGVLLREAQNIRSIATAPWLFAPGGAVVIAVLALNFLGDGLRDAADPYQK